MLKLVDIKKDYPMADSVVHALKGISISFRKSEFVSILGPSGCGKTTLLNIIGGLDQYTEGDLLIDGVSTKKYGDRDWDTYRNHSVGFVFQSYNLIPHQTVLSNVELALTLSGVSKQERVERAVAALVKVGLGDQLSKRPAELSGGQMQRVAIARALVNDPEIILADEPTGALDTETSVQVMEILKEVSRERLVVMVTHNPELAEEYSTRIIRMQDGLLLSDSMPLTDEEEAKAALSVAEKTAVVPRKTKKSSMSFFTAFKLSLRNLFTKKGRTMLTSFAGSIGIIGIALILAVSQGMTTYINHVQESTLSSYPITLQETEVDMTALMQSFMGVGGSDEEPHANDAVYKDEIIAELVEALSKIEANQNDLASFKTYLETELAKEDSPLKDAITGIQYAYSLGLSVYTKNQDGEVIKSDVTSLMREMVAKYMLAVGGGSSSSDDEDSSSSSSVSSMMMQGGSTLWQELLPGLEKGDKINDLLEKQYELVHGVWPNEKDEIVLVLNEKNELDDLTLYALGLLSKADIDAIIEAAASGTTLPEGGKDRWSYEEICELTFKTIFPYDFYMDPDGDGVYQDMSTNLSMVQALYGNAMELKVVGIVRPDPEAENTMLSGSIGYTHELTEHIILSAASSAVVQAQLASPNVDVLTGLPFASSTDSMSDAEKEAAFRDYVAGLKESDKAKVFYQIACLEAEKKSLSTMVEQAMGRFTDKDAVVDQISAALAEQMGGGEEQIREYLEPLTLEELKAMLRPSIEDMIKAQLAQGVEAQLTGMGLVGDTARAMALDAAMQSYTTEECASYYDEITVFSDDSYEQVMRKLGHLDLNSPSSINIYASSFENKDVIVNAISSYNETVGEEQKIAYTDYLGIMMSSITTIIDAISYVLIAFVSISLVVSSIMIGVITLISVQERTKEIGILRAIGASKRDVSGMFNAETMIIGFSSGLLGVVVTYLLCIPINLILNAVTGIPNLDAILPIGAAAILIAISVLLTLFSGLIPSRSAAKKDPVVALRSE